MLTAEELAKKIDDLYRELAPSFGVEPRMIPWEEVPDDDDKKLIIAVCQRVVDEWPPTYVPMVDPATLQ